MNTAAAATLFAAVLSAAPPFDVVEASIPQIQSALRSRRISSRELVQQYLARIATFEDRLNAIITVNPKALDDAALLDRERAQGRLRGPLHGIPIALKDNIHTAGLRTTGGALAGVRHRSASRRSFFFVPIFLAYVIR
jgi:amidase